MGAGGKIVGSALAEEDGTVSMEGTCPESTCDEFIEPVEGVSVDRI